MNKTLRFLFFMTWHFSFSQSLQIAIEITETILAFFPEISKWVDLIRLKNKESKGALVLANSYLDCLRYINTILVFFYQKCSGLLWEKKCSSDREKLFFKLWNVRIIFGNRMLFPRSFSDLINWNNSNSNWNFFLGFRNTQEKL